jgi:hypothetical protein
MIALEAGIEGEIQLARRLQTIDAGISDFRQPLQESVAEVKHSVDENFDARAVIYLVGGHQGRKTSRGHLWSIPAIYATALTILCFDDYAVIFQH